MESPSLNVRDGEEMEVVISNETQVESVNK